MGKKSKSQNKTASQSNDAQDSSGQESTKVSTEEFLKSTLAQLAQQIAQIAELQKKFFENQTPSADATAVGSTPMSSATNPLTAPINLGTKAGISAFHHGAEVSDNDKGMVVNQDNRVKLSSLVRDLNVSKGFGPVLTMGTEGTGKPHAQPKTLTTGEEVASFDISGYKATLI
mmetsp:Transcript_14983/g.22542  ORF Transcript_14983/g.22542 Transcript_14983/m.22542 type:complete len:173 (-) Transcript_14983:748-1266(-)